MVKGVIEIDVKSDVSEYLFEYLEDKIRNLLESNGAEAHIYDHVTGNSIRTRRGMVGKNENDLEDQTIKGELKFGEKIWFNDDLRCRLRICGFTQKQVEKLRKVKYVDLTLTDFKEEDMHLLKDGKEKIWRLMGKIGKIVISKRRIYDQTKS